MMKLPSRLAGRSLNQAPAGDSTCEHHIAPPLLSYHACCRALGRSRASLPCWGPGGLEQLCWGRRQLP